MTVLLTALMTLGPLLGQLKAPAADPNLLHNGGFEGKVSDRGVPEGWDLYAGAAAATHLAASPVARSGRQSLLLFDHDPASEVGVSQTGAVPAGAKYLAVSVWARAAKGGRGAGGFVQLRFLPGQQLVQVALRGSTDKWEQCVTGAGVPPGATGFQVFLYTHTDTICDTLVDDAEVTAMSDTAAMMSRMKAGDLSAFSPPPVTKLGNLHLETAIVRDGRPAAVVVVPADGRLNAAAEDMVKAVRRLTGATLPIKHDRDVALPLPENTIALGARTTNDLVSRLYDLHYTYIDQKYPGPGGYVVRSLHDPFGNGRNVIFVGASDDAGLRLAVAEFTRLADEAARGKSLSFGWVARIKLGEGLKAPDDADTAPSWEASLMYGPSSYFGWNCLSRRLALYYMTGEERFLREFLWLAFPDEKAIAHIWKVDGERIEDKDHPLSGPYHYNGHYMILLWDLVEESPFFTDEQHLRITQAFAEQLKHWQAEWAYAGHYYGDLSRNIGSRHDEYAALNLYCLSRYFSKHYPDPVWQKNMEAAEQSFASIGRSYYIAGEFDHLFWYTTALEPLLTYIILSGDRSGLRSGNLDLLLRGYDLIVDGHPNGENLTGLSLSFANKAAYLTGDGRFVYYRNLTTLETGVFRIGQSFWPTVAARPPVEIVGKVLARPLEAELHAAYGVAFPQELGYQFASYRSGLTEKDDYLLLDGFYGGSRNPYHCLTLLKLRIADKLLLYGYLNQVVARQAGLVESKVPMASALVRKQALGSVAQIEAEVPDFFYGSWRRRILHAAGRWAVVSDVYTPRQDLVDADLAVQWECASAAVMNPDGRVLFGTGGATGTIVFSVKGAMSGQGQLAITSLRGNFKAGRPVHVAALVGIKPKDGDLNCAELGDNAIALQTPDPAIAAFGPASAGDVRSEAEALLLTPDLIYAADLTSLIVGAPVVRSPRPVDLCWDLGKGEMDVEAKTDADVMVHLAPDAKVREGGKVVPASADKPGIVFLHLGKGRHHLTGAKPNPAVVQALKPALAAAVATGRRPDAATPPETASLPEWAPAARGHVDGAVKWLLAGPGGEGPSVYAVTAGKAYPLSADCRAGAAIEAPAEVLSATYWPEARLLLLGCKDDKVHAFDTAGKPAWTFQSVMHEDVRATGKTYWFKDAVPGISGLLTGNLTGEGTQAMVGSACTLEVLDAHGQLLKRVPQFWGNVWRMAILAMPDGARKLLAAKMPNGVNSLGTIDGRTWALDYGFLGLPQGYTDIPGWATQNTQDLIVADLNGDGSPEVVVDTNGTWNFVRAYAADGRALWAVSFGPALPYYNRHMRGVVVDDLDGDGKKEVVAATEEGIVAAFGFDGSRRWSRRLPSAPWAMAATEPAPTPSLARGRGRGIAAGCVNGSVYLLDALGRPTAAAALGAQVTALLPDASGRLMAATAAGDVALLAPVL